LYCIRKFPECRSKPAIDRSIAKSITSFVGWTFWGNAAVVAKDQGVVMLLNMFFGPVVNAAQGVGNQVSGVVTRFVSGFMTAVCPQITKSYASGDYEYLTSLTNYASKISFFLLFIVSLPIMLNIDWVLQLWLDRVPAHAGELCIVFMIASLCNAVSAPLWMNIFATGKVRNYQLGLSVAYVAELIAVYVLFHTGCSLVMGVSMKAVLNFVVIFIRLYYTPTTQPQFSLAAYARQVVLPVFCAAALTVLASFPLTTMVSDDVMRLLTTPIVVLISLAAAYFIGLTGKERQSLKKLINKHKKHA
jgi:O-antigen/teichoic acid export membrane protein